MGHVFHGWRRKLGLVTLMVALLFTAAWGRSQISADKVSLPVGGGVEYRAELTPSGLAITRFGQIELGQHQSITVAPNGLTTIDTVVKTDDETVDSNDLPQMTLEETNDETVVTNIAGYRLAGPSIVFVEFEFPEVPYWLVITPLTLLSAYLLLRKPNEVKQKKSSEPIHVGGT